MKKKNAFTLLEIMIVIFLIGLIGSIVGYNMKGSLDEGRAFKTKQAKARLRDILELEIAKGAKPEELETTKDRIKLLQAAGIAKSPEKLLKDGWGKEFTITFNADSSVSISSEAFEEYRKKKKGLRGHEEEEE